MEVDNKQTVVEFRESLLADISAELATNGVSGEEAFAFKALEIIEDSGMIGDHTETFFSKNLGPRGKIRCHLNGYAYSAVDGFMNLFVANYIGEDEPTTLGAPQVKASLEELVNFIENRAEISTAAPEACSYVDCIDLLNDALVAIGDKHLHKLRFILVTDSFITKPARKVSIDEVDGVKVETQIYDIETLFTLAAGGSVSDLEIDFTELAPYKVQCVFAGDSQEHKYKSYMGVVPGVVLANIYDHFGSQLLEGNVRSFLSTKGAVNKKIRQTLLTTPEEFFAFNNGISVTATAVKFDDVGNLVYAKDFQIINGGQTTACIATVGNIEKQDISKVNVLMKLTVVDQSMSSDEKQELLSAISRASNQQNKVSDADFASTHPFHVLIERISLMTLAPISEETGMHTYWFYERARGQYMQKQMGMTKSEREVFKRKYPKKQRMTKTDLAKYRYSWDEKPYLVSKGAESNFTAFAKEVSELWDCGEESQRQYNDEYFRHTVALAIIFNSIGAIVSDRPWYTGSFRANIVTYTMSLLHRLISAQYEGRLLDLGRIWQNQAIPDVLSKAIIKLSKKVYDAIVDESDGKTNITQRCKRVTFWNELKDKIELDLRQWPEFIEILIDQRSAKASTLSARKAVDNVKGEMQLERIRNHSVQDWTRLNDFVYRHHIYPTTMQRSMLCNAMRGRHIAKYGCEELLKLVGKCEEEGFKWNE